MKKSYTYLLVALPLILNGCKGNSNNSTQSKSEPCFSESEEISENNSQSEIISEQVSENDNVITNENYSWPFSSNGAYKGLTEITTSGCNEDEIMSLKIDNTIIEQEDYVNADATIYYDFDPDHPAHSEGVEHAENKITFNDEAYGLLPQDQNKGIFVPNSNLCEGSNVLSVTIGRVYAHETYDMNVTHGFSTPGSGDDFAMGNIRMVTSYGKVISPYKMVFYKPAAYNSKIVNTHEVAYNDGIYYNLGDGWGSTASSLSWDGNPASDGKYDIPFRIDFYFDVFTPDSLATFNVDTNSLGEGRHKVALLSDNQVVLQDYIYFDNKAPELVANIKQYAYVNKDYTIDATINDASTGIKEKIVMVDGKEVELPYKLSDLNYGCHNLNIYVSDYSDNYVNDAINFVILANSNVIDIKEENGNVNVSVPYEANIQTNVYKANKLNYVSANPLNNKQSGNGNIKDEFEVEVNDTSKPLYVTYQGTTLDGEKIQIEAFNYQTNAYDVLTYSKNNESVAFSINPINYVKDGKMTFIVRPYYFGNGSNKILWASDTQYLPKVEYSDINYMYPALMEYVAKEYKDNNITYFVHTGDVVDNNPRYSSDTKLITDEWDNATKAFEILDNNHIPYGVSAGNHDVGTAIIEYNYFSTYFGNSRYNSNPYFGGSLNDNECHYDLISVGDYDFIFMYLGFGVENDIDTVKWANDVLKTYSHRNAIIATHGYLDSQGNLDPTTNAQAIYDNIVVPNDNVKFVFCGHTDGNAINKKYIGGRDGRLFYEILNCSQFVQTKSYDVKHVQSGLNCNGEAFIKELTFQDNKLIINSFSPVINVQTGPFNNGRDDTTLDLDLMSRNRELTSIQFNAIQIDGDVLYQGNSNFDYDFTDGNNYLVYASDNASGYGFIIK